jgi:hypothetical protein
MVNGDQYYYPAMLTKFQKSQVRIRNVLDAITKRKTERSNDSQEPTSTITPVFSKINFSNYEDFLLSSRKAPQCCWRDSLRTGISIWYFSPISIYVRLAILSSQSGSSSGPDIYYWHTITITSWWWAVEFSEFIASADFTFGGTKENLQNASQRMYHAPPSIRSILLTRQRLCPLEDEQLARLSEVGIAGTQRYAHQR